MTASLRALLHGVVLAAALCIFAWPLTTTAGLASGVCGALVGCVLAQRLHDTRYRAWVGLAWAAVTLLLGTAIAGVLTGSPSVALMFDAPMALTVADVPRWAGVGAGLALGLRVVALRWRAALVIEGVVVVGAVAATVAAHRDGMIARPLAISDVFWTQGLDPVIAFLGLGMAAAVLLANVLARQRSLTRTAAQMAVVLVLGFLVGRHIHGRDEALRAQASGASVNDDKDRQQGAHGRGGKGEGKKDGKGATGKRLTDDVPSGSGGGRNRPVAVVVFYKDVKPTNGLYYFRHTAFSQFNGVRLVQSTRADADVDARQGFPQADVVLGGQPPVTAMRTEVATDVAMLAEHDSVFMLTDAMELAPLVNPDPARFRRAYHVVSSVLSAPAEELVTLKPGEKTWPDDLWAHYTAVPREPRYAELAGKLKQRLRPSYRSRPYALALSIKDHLEKTSIYSFARRHDDEEDPTASFLFSEDRRGYCVHLAHATALLLRSLRVPARVSAGYAVPAERLGQGSSLLIKAENAHAWAEIWLRDVGWVPIEVTPERSEVEQQPFVENDLQQMLGEMARRRRSADPPPPPRLPWAEYLDAARRALPWVLLATLAFMYACKLYRLAAPWLARRHPARAAYRAALDRLSSVGRARAYGETRDRFAARVATLSPAFVHLTDAHLAEALGGRLAHPVANEAVVVGREVRAHVPAWRWLVGALNPVSWLWSR